MKQIYVCWLFSMMFPNFIWANNIQVTNTTLVSQNTTSDFVLVQFDVSWENSWRVVGGTNNWDAAWIFIKYRIGAGPRYIADPGSQVDPGPL